MTHAERECLTLQFRNEKLDRGAVEETFFPWDTTIGEWGKQGLETDYLQKLSTLEGAPDHERFYWTQLTRPVFELERGLGYDPVLRMGFRLPHECYEPKVLEETPAYEMRRDRDGWVRRYPKDGGPVADVTPVVRDEASWQAHKEQVLQAYRRCCTQENLEAVYGRYRELAAEYPVRFRLQGFFWCPRELMGIEDHLMGYYDYPEMIGEINRFQIELYKEQLEAILKIVTPNVVLFEEDLSGRNGPMLSPDCFDEFLAPCYRAMIPFLKERGVKYCFVDTDGDFTMLIPHFLDAGVDGFVPMDVNAGVDIVEVRRQHPELRFIGGFNKLCIVEGEAAIDREFQRILPVIRQGGYLPGIDHQAAPSTPLAHYRYYIRRMGEVMAQNRGQAAH